MSRPNILFALADDASHVSADGHASVHTPSFDWVAEQGVRFTAAYTTNPKCAPSRASLLTGMHTWQLREAADHWNVFPSEFALYPDLLEAAGYHVGYTGKGWAPGDWRRRGLPRNPAGTEYNQHTLQPPVDTGISTTDYAANFAAFLDHRSADQPFCFWYGGREPHRRYVPGEGTRAGKKLADVQVPPYLPDDPVVRSDLADYAYETEWFDTQLGHMLAALRERGELANTIVVVTSDNGMPFPRVKGQMLQPDFRLPLAVCGPGIPGGRVVDDLVSFVDLAPTFLAIASVTAHPQMVGRSLLELLRSDRSGRVEDDRDRVYMGRERHDLGYEGDRAYPVRCVRIGDYLYVHNFRPDMWPAGNPETGFTNVDSSPTKSLVLAQHAAGDDRYFELAFGKHPADELYDVTEDPFCLTNLASLPEHADRLAAMRADLFDTLARTGDPRVVGDADGGDAFDRYEYVGEDHHSWRAYVEGRWRPQSY